MKKKLLIAFSFLIVFLGMNYVKAYTTEECLNQCAIDHPNGTGDVRTCTNNCYDSEWMRKKNLSICQSECHGSNTGETQFCWDSCYREYGPKQEEYQSEKKSNSATYEKIQCGEDEIPYIAAKITRTVIVILEIVTPIIIIFIGSLDLIKAIMASKDDEIKKGKSVFVRRLITGMAVFLTFVIVQFVINLVAPADESDSMWKCVDCFVNGDCSNLIK